MKSLNIVEDICCYWNSVRRDLSIHCEFIVNRPCHRIKVVHKKTGINYSFEINASELGGNLRLELDVWLRKAISTIDREVTNREVGGMYSSSPHTLSFDEEVALAEELRKVKEKFYTNCKRDRKGNRLSKEQLDKYEEIDGFGNF